MFLNTFRRTKGGGLILHFHAALEKMSAEKSMHALLEIALKEALALTQAEVGSLFLVDEDKKEFVLKKASGEYLSQFPEIRRTLNEGILGYVANRRVPLLVEDVRRDSRFQHGNGFSGYRTTSFISIPILLHEKLLGVLSLTDKKSRRPFSKKDLEWMTLFAQGLALHIERNHLLSEFKENHHALEESRNTVTFLQGEKRRLGAELELSQKME